MISAEDLDEVLDNTAPLWEALREMRLFITGGTGFMGTWLLSTLVAANRRFNLKAEAVVLTRYPERFQAKFPELAANPALTLWPGDVRLFPYPPGPFNRIIHGAVDGGEPWPGTELVAVDVIVHGTRRVLDFALSRGVKRLLFLSSGAIHGPMPPGQECFVEEAPGGPDPLFPRTSYAEAKRLAEHICGLYARQHQLPAVVARCFSFVGPLLPMNKSMAIGSFITDAMNGERIVVTGDGNPIRTYQYATDTTTWLWHLLERGQGGRAYNVGSDERVSIGELAQRIGACLAPDKPIEIKRSRQEYLRPSYVPSIQRARQELGLTNRVGLEEGVRRTAAFLRRTQSDLSHQPAWSDYESRRQRIQVTLESLSTPMGTTAQPLPAMIAAINRLYAAGHELIISWDAESAARFGSKMEIEALLAAWNVHYHHLRLDNSSADLRIDCRSLALNDFINLSEHQGHCHEDHS